MLYTLLRSALFSFDPETAHHLGLSGMNFTAACGLSRLLAPTIPAHPVEVMGLTFPNPVGLAAGLDKNGEYIDGLAAMGFGAIEIGTVTPRAQPGNPKPRLFRLPEAQAIINRMGFNNHGVDGLLANVARSRFAQSGGVLGINIGKNFDTPIDKAADDYLTCLNKVYSVSSYVTVNISSPNTKNLRELQRDEALDDLLGQLKAAQTRLADQHGRYVPLALKIAPDLEPAQIVAIADALKRHRIDGVIATNTTIGREGVEGLAHAQEAGGLSGAPVRLKSDAVVRALAEALAGEMPIIGVGGILNGLDARKKAEAGASMVQLYTGFIYRGPDLIREAATELAKVLPRKG